MRVLTIMELMQLTRIGLYELMLEISTTLRDLPLGSIERHNAIENLRNISRVLAGRERSLG
jgi:hypothetical protein